MVELPTRKYSYFHGGTFSETINGIVIGALHTKSMNMLNSPVLMSLYAEYLLLLSVCITLFVYLQNRRNYGCVLAHSVLPGPKEHVLRKTLHHLDSPRLASSPKEKYFFTSSSCIELTTQAATIKKPPV